jgi:hypothetical protein
MTALAADSGLITEKAMPWACNHAPAVAADSTQFLKGGILVLDQADGKVKKASTAAGLIALGVCQENYLTGTSNTRRIRTRNGVWGPFANSAAADAIAADDIGKDCFIVDDNTVALTSNSSARSRAGQVYEVDSSGVWVSFTFPLANS